MLKNNEIGIAFDLDGVITATAKLHFKAWREKAKAYGMSLTRTQNDKLRGLDRKKTALAICSLNNKTLNSKDLEEFCFLKNELYKSYLDTELNDSFILGNMRKTLIALRRRGYKTAVTSSSRNAPRIVRKLKLDALFHGIVDPNSIKKQKPFPDLYLQGAKLMNVKPCNCIGVEDAPAGIIGIVAAGMISVAIKWTNTNDQFSEADYILNSSDDLTITFFEKIIKDKIRNDAQ